MPGNSSGAVASVLMCRFQRRLGLKLSRTSRVADIPRLNAIDGADSGRGLDDLAGHRLQFAHRLIMARKPKPKRKRRREPDPASALASLAAALNRCDRAGLDVNLAHGIVITEAGYVLPIKDKWAARPLKKFK